MQLLPPWLDVPRGVSHPAFLWVLQKPLSCSRAVWAQTVSPAGAAVTCGAQVRCYPEVGAADSRDSVHTRGTWVVEPPQCGG